LEQKIAAEQRAGGFLEDQACIPAMRNVRSVEPPHAASAQIDHFVVGERARRAEGAVVKPDVASDSAVRRNRVGRGGKPFVERSALVRFDVAEGYPPKARESDYPRRRGRDGREQRALSAVKQHRLVSIDEELVEVDSGGRGDVGHEG